MNIIITVVKEIGLETYLSVETLIDILSKGISVKNLPEGRPYQVRER
jgi:hypothetical protein